MSEEYEIPEDEIIDPQVDATIDQLVNGTQTDLITGLLSAAAVYIVFDTGALTSLYQVMGDDLFKDLAETGRYQIVIPRAVITELENQRNTRRRDDDGYLLCPHELLSTIYEQIGWGNVMDIECAPDKKESAYMVRQMLASDKNKTGNYRLGKGDRSCLKFAREFDNQPCIIVTPDSDLDMVLEGLDTPLAATLEPDDYFEAIFNRNY